MTKQHRRGRLRSIETLADVATEDRLWAEAALRERRRSQTDIYAEFANRLTAKGIEPLSYRSFNRFSSSLDQQPAHTLLASLLAPRTRRLLAAALRAVANDLSGDPIPEADTGDEGAKGEVIPMPESAETVAVSTPLNQPAYDALRAQAKAKGKSISDLLRPIILRAIEAGSFPVEGREVEPNALPLAVRLPVPARDKLRRYAEAEGVAAAALLRAVLGAYLTERCQPK